MSGDRILDFQDTFSSASIPEIEGTSKLVEFPDNASYEAEYGAGVLGSIYMNSTYNNIFFHDGNTWKQNEAELNSYGNAGVPTVNDDETLNFSIGSVWEYDSRFWICKDNTTGAAVWIEFAQNYDGDILNLQNQIDSNDTDISNLQSDVSTNTTNIGTNTSDISGHETRITSLEGNPVINELDDVPDVDTATVTDGQVLTYEALTSTWKATTPYGGFTGISNRVAITDGTGSLTTGSLAYNETSKFLLMPNGGSIQFGSYNLFDDKIQTFINSDFRINVRGTGRFIVEADGTQIFRVDENGFESKQLASTPANPSTGYNKFYFKNDNEFYKLDSLGVEKRFLTEDDLAVKPSQAVAALDIDWSSANVFSKTISVNETYTFSNDVDGQTIVVMIFNNSGADIDVNFPTAHWNGGTAITTVPAGTKNVYTFIKIGTDIFATVNDNMSAV